MIFAIQKIPHLMLMSSSCSWVSMNTGAVLCQKGGAVVSQLVLKLKESAPPPPPPLGRRHSAIGRVSYPDMYV